MSELSRNPILSLEAVTGVAAIAGGVGLMINGLGMTEEQLPDAPLVEVTSWKLPGLALIAMVGLPQTAAAVLEWRRSRWAPGKTIAAGALLIGMELAELRMIPFSWLQPTFLAVGAAEIASGATRLHA